MAPKSQASKANRGVSTNLSHTAKPVDSDISDKSDEENSEEESEKIKSGKRRKSAALKKKEEK